MRTATTLLLAAGLIANGLAMLLMPETWYHAVPSVPHTCPFDPHFVRDIGCACLVCGATLRWLLRDARADLHHLIGDLPGVVPRARSTSARGCRSRSSRMPASKRTIPQLPASSPRTRATSPTAADASPAPGASSRKARRVLVHLSFVWRPLSWRL